MNFDINKFFETLILTDACDARSQASKYLDSCEMGNGLLYSGDVLTVEMPDGTFRHFRLTIEELDLDLE